MPTGIVRFFNTHKQYGFIDPVEEGPEVFVHVSELVKAGIPELPAGTKVDYELGEQHSKYPRAVELKTLSP